MGFRSRDEKVQVTLTDDQGNKGNFWLKKYFSKRDLNNAFSEVLLETQKLRASLPKKEAEEVEEKEEEGAAKKASPITLAVVLDMSEGEVAILKRALVAWDLVDDNGQALEISDREIEGLTIDTHDKLITEIKRINNMLDLEEQENLDSKSSDTFTPVLVSQTV